MTDDLNPALQQQGMTKIPALEGGRDVWLLFRSYELALFEEQMGKPILAMIRDEELLSIRCILNALLVGRAWEWRSAAKAGRKMPKLTAELMGGHMDKYAGGFTALAPLVVEALIGAIPGGKEALSTAADDADEDEGELPPFSAAPETGGPPASIGKDASETLPDAGSSLSSSGGTLPIPQPE